MLLFKSKHSRKYMKQYEVVKNLEEQYSIWEKNKPCPSGWFKVGCSGEKDLCLEFIEKQWTDMRPLSLRKHIESRAQLPSALIPLHQPKLPSLVENLIQKDQHNVSFYPKPSSQEQLLKDLSSGGCSISFDDFADDTHLYMVITNKKLDLESNKIFLETNLSLDLESLTCKCEFHLETYFGTCEVNRKDDNTSSN